MKKRQLIVVSALLILILAFTFTFAYFKITGNAIKQDSPQDNTAYPNTEFCKDSDGGVFSSKMGEIRLIFGKQAERKIPDKCEKDLGVSGSGAEKSKNLKEYYCKEGKAISLLIECREGCDKGACITPLASEIELSVATLKDEYAVNEKIELTDPPELPEVGGSGSAPKEITSAEISSASCSRLSSLFSTSIFTPEVKRDAEKLTERLILVSRSKCINDNAFFGQQIKPLIQVRAGLMADLIEKDPARAIRVREIPRGILKKMTKYELFKYIESRKPITGYLDVLHIDDFENPENSKLEYYVRYDSGKKQNKVRAFSTSGYVSQYPNAKVKVQGLTLGGKMAVDDSADKTVIIEKPKTPQEENLGEQKVLVIVAGFNGDAPPVTVEKAREAVFGDKEGPITLTLNENEITNFKIKGKEHKIKFKFSKFGDKSFVNANIDGIDVFYRINEGHFDFYDYTFFFFSKIDKEKNQIIVEIGYYTIQDFYDKNSYGKVKLVGDVLGPYSLEIKPGESAKDVLIKEALKEIPQFNYDRVILVFSQLSSECYGCGTIGKYREQKLPNGETADFSISWDPWFYFGIVAHELGHNFGADHANKFECTYFIKEDGNEKSYGSEFSCTSVEYGDNYDIMGGKYGTFNAPHKLEVGWLEESNTKVLNENEEGKFILKPLNEKIPSGDIQQIRIPIKLGKYYYSGMERIYYSLGYKKNDEVIYDLYSPKGIFIHLAQEPKEGEFTFLQTTLLNILKNDNVIEPFLREGESYYDSLNGLQIKLDKIDNEGAHVEIKRIEKEKEPNLNNPLIYYDFEKSLSFVSSTSKRGSYVEDKGELGNHGELYSGEPMDGDFNLADSGIFLKGKEYLKTSSALQDLFIEDSNEFTISMWIKSENLDSESKYLFNTWYLRFNLEGSNLGSNLYSYATKKNYESELSAEVNSIIEPDKWYYVALKYSGFDLKIYVNGVKVASSETRNADNPMNLAFHPRYSTFIGGNSYGGWFQGFLDDFRLYARALSDEEIMGQYQQGRSIDIGAKPGSDPERAGDRPQSKLVNKGNSGISGKLTISIQEKNGDSWKEVPGKLVNRKLNVNPGEVVKLDKLFNPSGFAVSEEGDYRVIAVFEDEKKRKIESFWEFKIS